MKNIIIVIFIIFNLLAYESKCQICAVEGCRACFSEDKCFECKEEYYLDNGKCKKCLEHCKRCNSKDKCLKCNNSFYISNGKCLPYPKISLDTIFSRTLLNLHNADPDQLEDYLNVIHSSIYDVMDVDLRKTSDQIWINVHNEKLNGVEIKTHTYKEICEASPDNPPITFDEFLDFAVENKIILQIEDKTSPTDNLPELAEIVKKHNAMNYIYVSKNSYEVLNVALDSFNNIMIFDVWNDNCSQAQATKLYEKALTKGGKVMLNASINKNKWLTPKEVEVWAKMGFLIEIGFNYTDGSIEAFLDFFNKYDIRYVNTIKLDNPTYRKFKAAFREKYGFIDL